MKQPNEIIQRLDAFIRKYYKNQLMKGAILFVAICIGSLLLVSFLEYYGRYTSTARALLFFATVVLALIAVVYYLLIPIAGLYRIRKTISYTEAAAIIGNHFPSVQDKLLNTLQLMEADGEGQALLEAAIKQKTEELKPVPFQSAIAFKANLKYLRYLLPLLLIFVLLLLWKPALIVDGTNRVLHYNQLFKIPAPFQFSLENKTLTAEQFGNFELSVSVKGETLPDEVYVVYEGQQYKLEKNDATHFSFVFRNLQHGFPFVLEANGFQSDRYELEVDQKPMLIDYQVHLDYPNYLGKQDEVLENPTDLNIPAGTVIRWNFLTRQTASVRLGFEKMLVNATAVQDNRFRYERKFFVSDHYTIRCMNDKQKPGDSLAYAISVIADLFPSIDVTEQKDSFSRQLLYFSGNASDDHGLTRLTFNFRYVGDANDEKVKKGLQTKEIPIQHEPSALINYVFNLSETGLQMADQVEYYFEVWDNDGVHGPKATKSKLFSYRAPGEKELKAEAAKGSEAMEKKMEETLKEVKDIQKDLKDMQRKLQSEKQLSWEEQRKMERLLQRQKELTKKVDELNKEYKQKNKQEQEFRQEEEKIMEKQQQLEKLFDQVMPEEMKQLMKQLENMMKLQNKDQIKNEMEKMQLSNKDVEKELDRMLEMYKQMEVEKKAEHALKELSELSKKQEELAQKTEQKKESAEELKKQQDKLNESFKDLKKELDQLKKDNKDLAEPKDLGTNEQREKEIEEKMQQSSDELSKGKEKKAAESEKESAEKMKEEEKEMRDKQEKDEEKKEEADADALREILENLLTLSKDQEDLMERFKKVQGYNPQYVQMAQEQKTIRDNAKLVEDSLLALSKTVTQLSAFINREVTKMNDHLDKANKFFSLRQSNEVKGQQQYAMSKMNNLALMLGDVLKQMEMDMKMNSKGNGKGKPKPMKGSGKPTMSGLKKMQDELNKQLKEGMNKDGKSGKDGKGMGSEQFARMAAQQGAIRQKLQQMMQQMDALEKAKMGGGNALGDLQKMMEETEKDLVNKRLTRETIMRQQEILTRLLEHEKAEKKQDEDTRREAEQAKEQPRPSPAYFEQSNRKQQQQKELFQTVPPEMNPYYKDKARQYFNQLGK